MNKFYCKYFQRNKTEYEKELILRKLSLKRCIVIEIYRCKVQQNINCVYWTFSYHQS